MKPRNLPNHSESESDTMNINRVMAAKRFFDKSYARLMREVSGLVTDWRDYWHDIWEPDYKAQPLKIDHHEVKQ